MAEPDYLKRIWLAEAPPGTWSSGPSVIYDFEDTAETINKYMKMGWRILGPYDLHDEP